MFQNFYRLLLQDNGFCSLDPENLRTEVEFVHNKSLSPFNKLWKTKFVQGGFGKDQLRQKGIEPKTVEFVEKLANHLNIDLESAHQIFTAYLISDYDGIERNMEALLSNEKNITPLLEQVEEFAWTEHRFLYKCVSKLVQSSKIHSGTLESPELDSLMEKMKSQFLCNKFVQSIIDQFSEVIDASDHLTSLKTNSKPQKIFRVTQNILLQQDIIQLLIWLFHCWETDFNLDLASSILKILMTKDFGRTQVIDRQYRTDNIDLLVESLHQMCLLLALKILDLLTNFLEVDSDTSEASTSKTKDSWEEYFVRIHHVLKADSVPAVIGYSECAILAAKDQRDGTDFSEKFGPEILLPSGDSGIGKDLMGLLRNPVIQGTEELKELSSYLMYLVMTKVGDLVMPEDRWSTQEKIDILSDILKCDIVADDIWESNLKSGLGLTEIRLKLSQFPAALEDTLPLLTALSRAAPDSCYRVCDELMNLQSYCESLDDQNDGSIEPLRLNEGHGPPMYRSTVDRRPYGDNTVLIPFGTVGFSAVEDFYQERLLIWRQPINGWEILLKELELFFQSPNDPRRRIQAEQILLLILACLETNRDSVERFSHFLSTALRILQSWGCFEGDEFIGVREATLACLAESAAKFPQEVLNALGTRGCLPELEERQRKDKKSETMENKEQTKLRPGAVGQYILDKNAACRADLCVKLLKLILNSLEIDSALKNGYLNSSVLFVLREVFPIYSNWHEGSEIFEEISLLICRICIESLGKLNGNSVTKIVKEELIEGKAGSQLLRLATVGITSLKNTVRYGTSTWIEKSHRLVISALSVLNQVLDTINVAEAKKLHLLEELYSIDNLVVHHVVALGLYLSYRFNDNVPRLALVVLSKLCKFPVSLHACLGTAESAFIDEFLSLFEENSYLKAVLLDFLRLTVVHQPALAEKLVYAKEGNGDETSGGCLPFVWKTLNEKEKHPLELMGIYRLLIKLWERRYGPAIEWISKQKNFWDIVASPLTGGGADYFIQLVGASLKLISQELEWCQESKGKALSKELKSILDSDKLWNNERLELLYLKLSEILRSGVEEKLKLETLEGLKSFLAVTCRRRDLTGGVGQADLGVHWLNLHWKILGENFEASKRKLKENFWPLQMLNEAASELISRSYRSSEHGAVVELLKNVLEIVGNLDLETFTPDFLEFLIPTTQIVLKEEMEDKGEFKKKYAGVLQGVAKCLDKLLEIQLNGASRVTDISARKIKNLTAGSLCCLIRFMTLEDSEFWLPAFRFYDIYGRLSLSLVKCYGQGSLEPKFLGTALAFFAKSAEFEETFPLVSKQSELLGLLSLDVIDLLKENIFGVKSCRDSLQAYHQLSSFYCNGIKNYGREFFLPAVYFLVSADENIIWPLMRGSLSLLTNDAYFHAMRISLELLVALASKFGNEWKKERKFPVHMSEVSQYCVLLLYGLSNPSLLQSAIMEREKGKKSVENKVFASAIGATLSPEIQTRLLKLLLRGVQYLRQYSPDLTTAMADENYDWESFAPLVLKPEWSSTLNIERFPYLSFGSLIWCIQLCAGTIRKMHAGSRSSSLSPSAHKTTLDFTQVTDKSVIQMLFEISVDLLLSQSVLVIRNPHSSEREKAIVRKEVTGELGPVLKNCQKYMCSSQSPSSGRKMRSVSPAVNILSMEYIKATEEILQTIARA